VRARIPQVNSPGQRGDGRARWFFCGGLHIWKARRTTPPVLFSSSRPDGPRQGHAPLATCTPTPTKTMIVLEGEIPSCHPRRKKKKSTRVPAGGHRQPPLRHPATPFKVSGARRRPAAVPAHAWLLPGVLLGRHRAPTESDDSRAHRCGPVDMGPRVQGLVPRRTVAIQILPAPVFSQVAQV